METKGHDLVGKDTHGGIYIGNLGGLWQSVVFGFAGMELIPRIPLEWKRPKFRVQYMNNKFAVDITPEGLTILANEANRDIVTFACAECRAPLGVCPSIMESQIVTRVALRE